MTIVTNISPLTGKENKMTIDVTIDQIQSWEGGVLIQNAMPNLSPEEREFMISGYTVDEQRLIFGSGEEEEEEEEEQGLPF